MAAPGGGASEGMTWIYLRSSTPPLPLGTTPAVRVHQDGKGVRRDKRP